MPIFATAGDKLYIGDAPMDASATIAAADFSSVTWVEVKNVGNLGVWGDETQSVDYDVVGEERTQTAKGTRKASMINVEVGIIPTDAGQLAMIAAEQSRFSYPLKLELNDKPAAGASPKNSTRLCVGLVMSAPENFGGANDVSKQNFNIQPLTKMVRVAASAT